MNKDLEKAYIDILKEELVPAMGCTEPIALAYAAALAKKILGEIPQSSKIVVSGNIIKNVKSVIVPHTGGLKGIETAVVAGFTVGDADAKLEVLSNVSNEDILQIKKYMEKIDCEVVKSDSEKVFDIFITARANNHYVSVHIEDEHTNVVRIEKDGEVLDLDMLNNSNSEHEKKFKTDRSVMSVETIIEFADGVEIELVKETIDRQIDYNTAIAKEGLSKQYGAGIGRVLLNAYGNDVNNRAKAWAAAGSDARMNGCELPVVINSGSGNQGMTASLPVIVYAEELKSTKDLLYRALLVSNLVTIHLKSGIGSLSAYCGAISAGAGAAAGITYLYGGKYKEIAHTIVNALAINSGVICDGAKASCAAKIASAVEGGLLGMQMYKQGSQFLGGDGIVTKGVEATIVNVAELARVGMKETDKEILKIMMDTKCK